MSENSTNNPQFDWTPPVTYTYGTTATSNIYYYPTELYTAPVWYTAPINIALSYYCSQIDTSPAKEKEEDKSEPEVLTIQAQKVIVSDPEKYMFLYKGETLFLGTIKDWQGREGVLDYAKTLLIAQMDNGGYLTEHAWGCCIRRAENDLKEAAKGVMALAAWLSGGVVKTDKYRANRDDIENFRLKLRRALGLK